MKKLHVTGQFKKDFKKYRRFPQKVAAFKKVANFLIMEIPLPEEYKQHPLKGDYKGCLDAILKMIIC